MLATTQWLRKIFTVRARPIRLLGYVTLAVLPSACGWCVENNTHPKALENSQLCAEYIDKGDLVSARARCEIALEYSPKYAPAFNLLGLIEYHLGHRDLATEQFKRALSLQTDFAEAHNNLGAIFLDEKKYGPACDEFKQAIEIDPGYVSARLNLGNCLFYDKNLDRAREEYLKCVEIDPNACDCRLGLGSISLSSEDHSDARTHFQKMTEACPQDVRSFYNLCWTQLKMNRCGEAVEACMGALAVDRDNKEARGALTEAQKCVALEDAAIVEYTDKIRKSPGDAELHFRLGVVYYDKKLVDYALNEFLSTIKLNAKNALAHYWAARVYDDQLRAEETIRMCKDFVYLVRGEEYAEQKQWCVSRVEELQYK